MRADDAPGSFSINLDTGAWGDFAIGAQGGDAVSLWAYLHHNGDNGAAARDLVQRYGPVHAATFFGGRTAAEDRMVVNVPRQSAATRNRAPWIAVMPVPTWAPAPPNRYSRKLDGERWTELAFVHRWVYADMQGNMIGCTVRFQLPDGTKDIVPQTFCYREQPDGSVPTDHAAYEWRWQSFPKPRPLYNLPDLAAVQDRTVLLVEGEKTADAAAKLFPMCSVLTWPGGGKAVRHVDWEPIRGRRIMLWPDRDLAGYKTALDIARSLMQIASAVRVVLPPQYDQLLDGWDLADWTFSDETAGAAQVHARENLHDVAAFESKVTPLIEAARTQAAPSTPARSAAPEPEADAGERRAADAGPSEPAVVGRAGDDGGGATGGDTARQAIDAPFRALGFRTVDFKPLYYYMPKGLRNVVEISKHSDHAMLNIAPLTFWEREFPSRNGADWQAAANWLIAESSRVGIFDYERIRGRGAWWDDGRVVLHLGDRLIVDGSAMQVNEIPSRFIYEEASPLRADISNALDVHTAHKLVELCDMLSWEYPVNGKLLAGWCFIAPICGALNWRPHIWVTGAAGTGKSWVYDNILKRVLGDTALAVQSATTEAGLRQTLGSDALPVIFDEAEAEDKRAQERIQNVLELMRQASSDTGAAIIKGSASGVAKRYHIRSMFAFSSVNVGLQYASDKTRVAVLGMAHNRKETAMDDFRRIQRFHLETMTDEFVQRLHARAIRMIPVVRHNARIFATAGAIHFGNQRMGDRIGPMLAGAYALHSDRQIALEDAQRWIAAQEWTDEHAMAENRDEATLWRTILDHQLRVEGQRGTHDRAIGELIEIAWGRKSDDAIYAGVAFDTLRRNGIRPDLEGDEVYVHNTHSSIKRILQGTPWLNGWPKVLLRMPNARVGGTVRFGYGAPARTVAIKMQREDA